MLIVLLHFFFHFSLHSLDSFPSRVYSFAICCNTGRGRKGRGYGSLFHVLVFSWLNEKLGWIHNNGQVYWTIYCFVNQNKDETSLVQSSSVWKSRFSLDLINSCSDGSKKNCYGKNEREWLGGSVRVSESWLIKSIYYIAVTKWHNFQNAPTEKCQTSYL